MSRKMSDYIKREDAIRQIVKTSAQNELDIPAIGTVIYILSEMDSADVRENVNGEWEEIEVIAEAYDISGVKTWASKMKCDQCGFTAIAIEGHFSQYNFCPNCGADMRQGSTDRDMDAYYEAMDIVQEMQER